MNRATFEQNYLQEIEEDYSYEVMLEVHFQSDELLVMVEPFRISALYLYHVVRFTFENFNF